MTPPSAHPTPLPSIDAVKALLGSMLDKHVLGKPCAAVTLGPKAAGIVATYVTDAGALAAVGLFDLPCASYLGAALAMFPVGLATESIKAGKLDPNVAEGFHEVANVGASLLNADGAPHVKLKSVVPLAGGLPPEVAALIARPKKRRDVEVTVTGFGSGKLAFLI
jgi:hypothetical protein